MITALHGAGAFGFYFVTKPLRIFRHSLRKVRGAGPGWGGQAVCTHRQSSSFGCIGCFGSGMACMLVSLFSE
jgi:hypothetical protein